MHSKLKILTLFAVIGVLAALCAVAFLSFVSPRSVPRPETSALVQTVQTVTASTTQEAIVGLPILLSIPAININAAVENVGLTPDGAMDAPKNPTDVGWYELGPRPGEVGSAVIAGHVGWKDSTQAAFDKVASLRKGDILYVKNAEGATITFVVRELRMYDKDQDASSIFNSFDGKAHLNLIACEGVWSAATKSYSKRLVVFADKQ